MDRIKDQSNQNDHETIDEITIKFMFAKLDESFLLLLPSSIFIE
jgi:hypothetical protein